MAFFAGLPLLVIVQFFLAFVILLGLISVTAWAARRRGGRRSPRLAVIDYANVDRRRRLILVRRDNVEHLVMIGGPTDLIVESNFVRRTSVAPRAPPSPPSATTGRQASRSRPLTTDPAIEELCDEVDKMLKERNFA
jgi:flagellar biogenesis protein FliO